MAFLITVVGETVCAGRHDSHLVAILMAPRWPELRGLSEPLVQQLSSISVALLAVGEGTRAMALLVPACAAVGACPYPGCFC